MIKLHLQQTTKKFMSSHLWTMDLYFLLSPSNKNNSHRSKLHPLLIIWGKIYLTHPWMKSMLNKKTSPQRIWTTDQRRPQDYLNYIFLWNFFLLTCGSTLITCLLKNLKIMFLQIFHKLGDVKRNYLSTVLSL